MKGQLDKTAHEKGQAAPGAGTWLSRLRGSIKSVTAGAALVAAVLPAMWCNEGRAVTTERSLEEGAGAVVAVAADRVDPGNDGRLVHVSGLADTVETLTDPDFAVSAVAIRLVRTTEMFQWAEVKRSETRRGVDGEDETVETISYETTWSESAIDSARFSEPAGHANPTVVPFPSKTLTAGAVTLGAFSLPPELVAKIAKSQPLALAEAAAVPKWTAARLVEGGLYRGRDPSRPAIGDVRIRFAVVRPQGVSVVARQTGATFGPYATRAGEPILMLSEGTTTAEAMFDLERTANRLLTWIVRGALVLLAAAGLWLVFRPVAVVGAAVPVLGGFVGAGLGVFSLALAAVLALVTMSAAWLVYRPAVAAAAVLAVAAVLLLLRRRARRRARPAG